MGRPSVHMQIEIVYAETLFINMQIDLVLPNAATLCACRLLEPCFAGPSSGVRIYQMTTTCPPIVYPYQVIMYDHVDLAPCLYLRYALAMQKAKNPQGHSYVS